METSHPATCLRCCKKIVDRNRIAPESVAELMYSARQLIIISITGGAALLMGVCAAVLIITGNHKCTNRRREMAEANARRRSLRASFQEIAWVEEEQEEDDYRKTVRPVNRNHELQVIHNQHRKLAAIEKALQVAEAPMLPYIEREFLAAQKELEAYVNSLACRRRPGRRPPPLPRSEAHR